MFMRFLNDQSGATAIEYALIAAFLSIGIIASVTALRGTINNTFNEISAALTNANATN